MSPRVTQVLLGLSLLLNCFVLAGFVYRSWIVPPVTAHMLPHPPPPGPRPSPVETLVNDLNLDDSQRQAVRGVFDQYAVSRRERSQEIQKTREQLAAEFKAAQMDMTRIEPLIDRVSRLRSEQANENMQAFAQLEPKLRPDQRERMHAILADRFANPQMPRMPAAPGGRAPGPGRPPQ